MFDSYFWAFLGLAALLTMTPGADTVLTLRNSLTAGTKAGIWTMAGICSGFFFQPLLASLGVAALFVHSAIAFNLVKGIGALYLFYLGFQSLRTAFAAWRKREENTSIVSGSSQPAISNWRYYREGLLTNALNPKTSVFYFAILPQFIGHTDAVVAKCLLMSACHYIMGAIWLTALALLAGRTRSVLLRPRVRACLEGFSGVAMIGFGIKLGLSSAR